MEEARNRNGSRKHKKGDNNDPASSSLDTKERRLRRSLRKAEKVARQLVALGLDENGDELDNFSLVTYPVREWKFKIPGMTGSDGNEVACNPVVTVIAVAWLWGIVMWCSVDATNALAKLDEWRSMISLATTWLIHGTKVIYFVFLLFIVYKYGNVKLGGNDDKPEFSNICYLSMIFAAGASNSIMAYSVYEPLSMRTDHFYAQSGYRTQDELDMFAINIAVTDWGFGGWAPYTLCAVAMSLAVHRFKLPMTHRSCFYPILGQYTWGWMGDVIDGFIIVATLANVFTALGLVAMNFVVGFEQMGWINQGSASEEQTVVVQNVVVWILSIVSLVAVLSGLHGGIRLCCIAAATLFGIILLFTLLMEDTKFLLNLQVQEVGVYLQTSMLQLNFWTDAFGQLREGSGRAVDGKAADPLWYCDWFNFAQLWWVVAGAVNGQFIATISRGRRIGEVVFYSLMAPVVCGLVWYCSLGGIGMRQARQAAELELIGQKFYNNSAHFIADGSELCYDVPQQDLLIDGNVVFTNHMPGITPVCKYDAEQSDLAIYNVLNSFSFPRVFQNGTGGFGPGLSVLFMLASALFYMAAAGSASLVVDKMASSGRKNNHLARRVFWLVTVGALATGLLSTGGADGLSAIQTGIVICGLPCTILLCYLLQSVTLMCQQSMEQEVGYYQIPNQAEFSMPVYGGIFNIVEFVVSLGKVNPARVELGMGNVSAPQLVEFVKGLFVPFVSLWQVLNAVYPQNRQSNYTLAALYVALYIAMLCCCIVPLVWPELQGLTWMFLIIHGGVLAWVRASFRARFQIRSNTIADLVASTLFWPQVLSQMTLHCQEAVATRNSLPASPIRSSISATPDSKPTRKRPKSKHGDQESEATHESPASTCDEQESATAHKRPSSTFGNSELDSDSSLCEVSDV